MNKDIVVNTPTGSFKMVKDEELFSAYWICTKGRYKETLSSIPNIIVPHVVGARLYQLALKQGFSVMDLAAPVKPERPKATGTRKPRGPGKSGIRIKVSLKSKSK